MVQHTLSWWGIKNNGEDISPEIMRIINNAKQFIIVCGYNFTFRTSAGARPFFDALQAKSVAGIKVMLILPPKLHGKYNPQPAIIHHCLTNNLPVILNHQNHSKWLLTDEDLYYGSSNFTNASWKDRVEVVSIHEHTKLAKNWSQETIKDFKTFINKEIIDLNKPKRKMKNYRGLLTSTRNTWNGVKPLINKLNPSIQKVIITLENYDKIISCIESEVIKWFDCYSKKEFEMICNLSSRIINSVDDLCEYAYGNIYNETVYPDNIDVSEQNISEYNARYEQVISVIDQCIEELKVIKEDQETQNDLSIKNLSAINKLKQTIEKTIK